MDVLDAMYMKNVFFFLLWFIFKFCISTYYFQTFKVINNNKLHKLENKHKQNCIPKSMYALILHS
jgi:hypothetical protein